MPSSEYKNENYESPIKTAMRDDFQYPSQADTFRRKRLENTNYLRSKAFRQSPKEKEKYHKEYENKLNHLRRQSPKMAAGLEKGKKSAMLAFLGGLFQKIDWSVDWLFILLISFAFLKDIFDIAFGALGALPILGTAGAAVGIILSFVGDLMFLCLVVTTLVLVGGSFKNRGMAKYYLGIAMEFVAEALPGISLLPWTVIYVGLLYFCVLYDRAYGAQAVKAETGAREEENVQIPQSGAAADNYMAEDRLAA
jgi:hypothetical protein